MSSTESQLGDVAAKALATNLEKWKRIAFRVARVDQEKVKQGIVMFYRANGKPPPSHFVWLDSPIAGAIAASLLSKWTNHRYEPDVQAFYQGVRKKLNEQIDKRTNRAWWKAVDQQITKSVHDIYGVVPEDIKRGVQVLLVQNGQGFASEGVGLNREEGSLDPVVDKLVTDLPAEFSGAVFPLTAKAGAWENRQIFWNAVTSMASCSYGSLDAELPFFDFCAQGGLKCSELSGAMMLSQNCGWWWPLPDICIITARPTLIRTDANGRLHSERGPAIQYPDTWGIYAWHGEIVPPRFIRFTRNMNAHDILHEPNAEVRRRMLDLFGLDAFMLTSGARKVQEDETGELWRQEFGDDEPIVMVRVTNSTPEPEGHMKKYFLRVPPTVQTCREGVAWTFGMNAADYGPKRQT